ncbi:expressed unknown protein [Seminavis robusta]|uniref:Uncharacterized protein n=1 Tax=Seminavis robusta TaxID=568900 RepID=A0A9N8HZB8_9STRA|nr:expressed unknown protein [Seminavis robusta]|eukprot:Sro2229_g319930.1 n/a (688) ;mRNA; f:4213-6276
MSLFKGSPLLLLLVLLFLCNNGILVTAKQASLHRSFSSQGIRGLKNPVYRGLKKDDSGKDKDSFQNVESAFGDKQQNDEKDNDNGKDEDEESEEDNDKEEDEKEKEDNVKEDNKDQDDKGVSNDPEGVPAIKYVLLPEFTVELGVDAYSSNRQEGGAARNNYDAIEMLMATYFETLLPRDLMGPNYLTAEMEARMSKSVDFGQGALLNFKIRGQAQYLDEPVPSEAELKDRLIWFLSRWQGQGQLERFLNENGLYGSKISNIYVDQEQVTSTSANSGFLSGNQDIPEFGSANGQEDGGEGDGKSKAGLVVGLIFFLLAFAAVAYVMYKHRESLKAECGVCYKSAREKSQQLRDKHRQRQAEKRGWRDFDGSQGSNEALEGQVDGTKKQPSQSRTPTSEPPKRIKLVSWFQQQTKRFKKQKSPEYDQPPIIGPPRRFSKKVPPSTSEPPQRFNLFSWFQQEPELNKNNEIPDDVLPQIQVVVDNDHVLKQSTGRVPYRSQSLTEQSKRQFSASTVPHANRRLPPENTMHTHGLSDDEESLNMEDPVVRYAPPTRSQGKVHRGQHNKSKHRAVGSPSTVASTPSPPPKPVRAPSPPIPEDDVCTNTFADWANFLNPCLMPNLAMFQEESQKLDDLVQDAGTRGSLFEEQSSVMASVGSQQQQNKSSKEPRYSSRDKAHRYNYGSSLSEF